MKQLMKKVPIFGSIMRNIYRKWANHPKRFAGSRNYWTERYDSGGNSGDGSYRELAEFKAEILNEFVLQNGIKTVIEYGCGDGNQLKLAKYPSYTGFDVSSRAVSICKEGFLHDPTKTFLMMDDYSSETAELTLSLDVIYHLIEDSVFTDHMYRLFDSSERFVAIYASDTDENSEDQAAHVKHRNFTRWVTNKRPEWELMRHIPNRYPYSGHTTTGSFADFFIYAKIQ